VSPGIDRSDVPNGSIRSPKDLPTIAGAEHAVLMSTTPMIARRQLQTEIESAMREQASAAAIVELVIRSGWQPRPVPDPNSEYLEGVLANGVRVPIEIRHSLVSHPL
jgi:hypothetical protein